jgi:hypothetical protein
MDPNNTYMYRAIEQLHPGRAASSKVIERETSIGNARANVITRIKSTLSSTHSRDVIMYCVLHVGK